MQQHAARRLTVAAGAAVVLADQLAKLFVTGGHAAATRYVPNPGLILGLFPASRALLVIATIAVLGVFLAVVGRWAVQVGISPVIPGVIAGGALANSLDRAQFGTVRDFLATPWLVVDIADIAVVAGIVALGIALALRMHQLRASSRTVTLDLRNLRAVVVPATARATMRRPAPVTTG